MSAWQPIETVPKDGSRVLLLETSFVTIDEWIIPEDHTTVGTFYGKGRWRKEHQLPLTHWMPLPSLPAASSHPAGLAVYAMDGTSPGEPQRASDGSLPNPHGYFIGEVVEFHPHVDTSIRPLPVHDPDTCWWCLNPQPVASVDPSRGGAAFIVGSPDTASYVPYMGISRK